MCGLRNWWSGNLEMELKLDFERIGGQGVRDSNINLQVCLLTRNKRRCEKNGQMDRRQVGVKFKWKRDWFKWEKTLVEEFNSLMTNVVIQGLGEDCWC